MARTSFTFKKKDLLSLGSFLQNEPVEGEDNDSALKGDGYVATPTVVVTAAGESFFDAKVVDYGTVDLTWGLNSTLFTVVGADPVPTEIVIRYDTLGEPQTVVDGGSVVTITPSRQENTHTQHGLPDGAWVYYSLFVKYESTATRSWYEKVGSVYVLVPNRYNSTEMLWDRIPRHYRIQDGADSGPISTSSELFGRGPLYRLLDVFGWDIDRLRTLVHHQMVTRDPTLATPEALEALAAELGVPMTTEDLGTNRLRKLLNDIGYLRKNTGTYDGVIEWLKALSGCDVRIRPLTPDTLTLGEQTLEAYVVGDNDDSDTGSTRNLISDNNAVLVTKDPSWVSEPVPGDVDYVWELIDGIDHDVLKLYNTGAGNSYRWAVLKLGTEQVSQAKSFRLSFDAFNMNGASVVGVAYTPNLVSSASVGINPTTGAIRSEVGYALPEGYEALVPMQKEDGYGITHYFAFPGDGTFTTQDMFLHIFFVFGPNGSLNLTNLHMVALDTHPYEIDIYSQRINLIRDPQFVYGYSSPYWGASNTGTVVYSAGTKHIGASASTGASVTFKTTGSSVGSIPVELDIPYYITLTDDFDNIEEVRLVSTTHGVLATATEHKAQTYISDSSYRKTWELSKESGYPWLPLGIEDCYLEIVAVLSAGAQCRFKEPIFEPNYSGGDYFDGDNTNGGWLQGPTASSGVADYRWGNDGQQHVSFSYYTLDYQRTVSTVSRLLPYIIPVTQTDTPAALLNFNKIYGYSGNDQP